MPKVLKVASQTIRNLLKPATQHSFSEDRLRNDRQSYIAMTRALVARAEALAHRGERLP